MKEEKTQKLG